MKSNLDKAILTTSKKFKGALVGEKYYGWNYKSCGQKIRSKKGLEHWVQVSPFSNIDTAQAYNERINGANIIKNVKKPIVLDSIVWEEEQAYYVGILMTYVSESTFSESHIIIDEFPLQGSWLESLKKGLENLSNQSSSYISCRQDLIDRRVKERYGNINCKIDSWCTIHGDLNWANITRDTPYFLDWEGWGHGPRVLDICFLYAFSLAVPSISDKIKQYFEDMFLSPDGKICLLFVCSELLRMNEIYSEYNYLVSPLNKLAKEILKDAHFKL